jgi:site-specific DNA-methyltransferase (adenine-specific)
VIRDALVEAFYASHGGFSIDSLLAKPQLQSTFHEACVEAGLIGGPADWNRELLRLRKTGGFPKRGQVKRIRIADEELETYSFAAEIAWRLTSDKFGHPSLDEILCDPVKAEFFDRTAKRFAPGFVPSQYRWAALHLRKASRELVDEAKKYHFMFTKRDFAKFQPWRRCKPSQLAGERGIYLLRGSDKQPLFIGHAINLGSRFETHAKCRSVNDAVEHIAVISGEDLPGVEYQNAFKEDLVRRNTPKWNVSLVGLNMPVVD